MTTSTDFESQLDDNPADWTLRSIYADWLEEQGNPRADSQRWMVANRGKQFTINHYTVFRNSWVIAAWDNITEQLTGIQPHELFNTREYPTRIAAEIDLHNALVKAGEIACALIEEVEACGDRLNF